MASMGRAASHQGLESKLQYCRNIYFVAPSGGTVSLAARGTDRLVGA